MDGRKTRPPVIWSSSSSSSSYGKTKPARQLQKSSNLNSHKRE
jgi:hypothetical protein